MGVWLEALGTVDDRATRVPWGCAACLALTLALLIGCANLPSVQEYETTLRCPDCRSLTVLAVIDGDTFDSGAGRVRLFGVDTPERGERCFSHATHWLRQLSAGTVRVEQGPRQRDPGGRLLFYAYTEAGNSIDEMLIREGLATAWTRDGQHRGLLLELEQAARRSGKGCLW